MLYSCRHQIYEDAKGISSRIPAPNFHMKRCRIKRASIVLCIVLCTFSSGCPFFALPGRQHAYQYTYSTRELHKLKVVGCM